MSTLGFGWSAVPWWGGGLGAAVVLSSWGRGHCQGCREGQPLLVCSLGVLHRVYKPLTLSVSIQDFPSCWVQFSVFSLTGGNSISKTWWFSWTWLQSLIDFFMGLIRLSLASCFCPSIWAASVLRAFILVPALSSVFLCIYCCLHGVATSSSSQSVVGKRIKFSSYILNWHISHLLSLLLKI